MAQLRLATFNCENLFARFNFRENIDPEKAVKDGWLADKTKFTTNNKHEKRITAQAIKETKADVIVLQEVESLATLKKFKTEHIKNSDYRYLFVVDGNDPRFIDIGVMSKYPIEKIDTHINDREANGRPLFSRDCLELDVVLPNQKRVRLFANHFKSMLDMDDPKNGRRNTRAKRMRQAQRVREIVEQEFPEHDGENNFVILGDLNDYLQSDAQGDTAIGDLVGWNRVVNVVERLDPEEQWTHYYEGNKSAGIPESYHQLDYILLSKQLADSNPSAKVEIIRKGLPRKAEKYDGERFQGVGNKKPAASDHCPVVVHLEV